MVRRSRSVSYLVPLLVPIQILPENPNRELYSIQNLDAANSAYVSPFPNVTAAAGDYVGQEIVARGYVSDDMDQGTVYCVAGAASGAGGGAAVRIIVQETVTAQESKPGSYESQNRTASKWDGRAPVRRESRVM